MADASEKSVDQLLVQLSSKDATERRDARAALVKTGAPAVPSLLNALDAPQQHVRWEAAKSLAEIADPAAVERLVAALGDKDSDVRWVVGEALIALGRETIKPLLVTLTKGDLPDGVDEGAHHVLHELAKRPDLASLLAPVLEAFKGPEPEIAVPLAAEKALNRGPS